MTETNNKNLKDFSEKKEFLARTEIKTMQKDISRLREAEAEKERGRIAALKTEEEAKKERERQERAQKEAEERKSAQKEEWGKEEELKKLKEEREKKEEIMEKEETAKAEFKTEIFRERFKETQAREEEERKKFLERVRSQAEGLPTIPSEPVPPPIPPVPPISPAPPAPPEKPKEAQKPSFYGLPAGLPKKPSLFEKIWIRIVVALLILAILGGIATFWYWFFVIREKPETLQSPLPAGEEITPAAPEVAEPSIIERILGRGYQIPATPRLIDTIVIHSTYNVFSEDPYNLEGIVQEYQYYGVAPHYIITRDGTIYRFAPDESIAYHAGTSQMPDGRTNVNNFSIGIELIQTKTESPTEVQYQTLAQLVKYLKQEYNIPSENILGHKDISPSRKTDPWNFDWEKFNQLIQ